MTYREGEGTARRKGRGAMKGHRHQNRGLRKICDCPRRTWAKCPHSWHFNFKPKGGPSYRFSVDSRSGEAHRGEGRRGDTRRQLAHGDSARARSGAGRQAAQTGRPSRDDPGEVRRDLFRAPRASRSARTPGVFQAVLRVHGPNDSTYGARRSRPSPRTTSRRSSRSGRRAKRKSTRNKYVQTVKTLFRWAAKKGYLARNPAGDSEALKRNSTRSAIGGSRTGKRGS